MKNRIWIKRTTGETVRVVDRGDRLVTVQEGEGQRVYFLSLFKTLCRR